jgi:glycosyltransferase involved in cell wall biosynthesis
MKLSAVILTKNEQDNIERCLKSLDFCDEVLIIDDNSTDNTIKIIEEFKKRQRKKNINIFKRKLNEDFSAQKNFAFKMVKGDWVLFLDADEEISKELREEIKKIFFNELTTLPEIAGFYIKRRDFWWGRELKFGEVLKVRNKGIIRLVKKNSGFWKGKVHEEFIFLSQKFKIKKLKNFINHYPHQTIKKFLEEINFYSTLRAKELFENNKKTNIFEIIFYPLTKFILNYFIYLGFLDGIGGFTYSFLMSFHSFLVRAKLYQYQISEKKK